jgi:hypothetical protein
MEFKSGMTFVNDATYSGCPSMSRTGEIWHQLKNSVHDKGCTTIHDLVTSDGNLISIMSKLFDTNSEFAADWRKIRASSAD